GDAVQMVGAGGIGDIDLAHRIQGYAGRVIQSRAAAGNRGGGGGVPGRARGVDGDTGSARAVVGDIEPAGAIQGDAQGLVQPRIAARDRGRGGGVPRRARGVDRDRAIAVVGDVEVAWRDVVGARRTAQAGGAARDEGG